MKRRILILAFASVFLFTLVLAGAVAEEYLPFASGSNSASISLKISGGTATATGDATALATGTYAKVTVYVQKLIGTSWKDEASSSGGASAQASCSTESGEYYRGRVVAKFYDSSGNLIDELTKNSGGKQAP